MKDKNLLCITYYNEAFKYLEQTLLSSIYLDEVDTLIIFDGVENISSCVLNKINIDTCKTDVFYEIKVNEGNIIVYVKSQKKGKLDSIKKYFEYSIINSYNVVFQVDTGTSFSKSSILSCINEIINNKKTACYTKLSIYPGSGDVWRYQYFGFSFENKLNDYYCQKGYHSVIHGQFNAIDPCKINKLSIFDNIEKVSNHIKSVEDRFITGSIMRLEEDSVSYLEDDLITTDYCDNISELKKQRRRWINGSLLNDFNNIGYDKLVNFNLLLSRTISWSQPAFLTGVLISWLSHSLLSFLISLSLLSFLFLKASEFTSVIKSQIVSLLVISLSAFALYKNGDVISVLLFTLSLFSQKLMSGCILIDFHINQYASSHFFDLSWGTKGISSSTKWGYIYAWTVFLLLFNVIISLVPMLFFLISCMVNYIIILSIMKNRKNNSH